MKKIFWILVTGISSTAVMYSQAQASSGKQVEKKVKHFDSTIYAKNDKTVNVTATVNPAETPAATIAATGAEGVANKKAVKNFNHDYHEASANWYSLKQGYMASFSKNGKLDKVFYDSKGHWMHTLEYYGEKQLPATIRATVKSVYYDYPITGVLQVYTGTNTGYFVYMQDEQTSITVRIVDGEMEEISRLINRP